MESDLLEELLADLNEIEQKYGRVPAEADPNYDPTGEVNARVQYLKRRLAELGAELEWDGWSYRNVAGERSREDDR